MQLDWFSALWGDELAQSIETFLQSANSLIPASLQNTIILFAVLSVFLLGAGLVLRIFFGEKCTVNRSISGFMAILFIYALTALIYSLQLQNVTQYLVPLPFAVFRNDLLIVSFSAYTTKSLLCSQLLSLIILGFIIHIMNFLLPSGQSFFPWLLMRLVGAVAAVAAFIAANWALNTFLPTAIAQSAPVILVTVLAVTLLVSLFNPLLCILFTAANPIIGLLYTFFFSNTIGKNLTRAVLSAALICVFFYAMEYFGLSAVYITKDAMLRYSPFAAAMLGVWFIFDYKL